MEYSLNIDSCFNSNWKKDARRFVEVFF